MDDLIQHCLRELSYDGDLGCDISRLRESIELFYTYRGSTSGQKIDDAYCAFTWSVLVKQPNVRVGVVPEGSGAEVYIAPQNSAKRKARAKGEEMAEAAPVVLEIIPDAAIRPLEQLRKEYGDKLRVAVDLDTIFRALTGSHIRDSKLSPMVYTALQLISRGHEAGISSIDLARKSGYDPKTCHYLVKQLLSLNLVVKRGKTSVSSSTIVHRDLFNRDATWQNIVVEENQVREAPTRKIEDEGLDDEDDEGNSEFSLGSIVQFDPIDERHLSSLDLMRGRLVTLLQNSPHGLHAANNLLPKLGFANPTKRNRRFFIARCVNELIRQRIIEKVRVPGRNQRLVTCFHLLDDDSDQQPVQAGQPPDKDMGAEMERVGTLTVNFTLHRQIIDLLDRSGDKGMTLGDLCEALGDFDRRTVELLLEHLHANAPPQHLADLSIAHGIENNGRERRYRYWTVAHYRTMAAKEDFKEHSHANVDLAATGGFMSLSETQFYDDEASHNVYVDGLRGGHPANTSGPGKAKRPHKNPILPDGTIKRGRPRKYAAAPGAELESAAKVTGVRGRKRKKGDDVGEEPSIQVSDEPPPKRKRGRPPKRQQQAMTESSSVVAEGSLDDAVAASVSVPSSSLQEQPSATKRGRGPNRKKSVVAEAEAALTAHTDSTVVTPSVPRKRGRPRKQPLPAVSADAALAPEQATEEAERQPSPGRNVSLDSLRPSTGPPSQSTSQAAENAMGPGADQHQSEDLLGDVSSGAQSASAADALTASIDVVSPCILGDQISPHPVHNTTMSEGCAEENSAVAFRLADGPEVMLDGRNNPVPELMNVDLATTEAPSGLQIPASSLPSARTDVSPDSMQNASQIPIDPALLAESIAGKAPPVDGRQLMLMGPMEPVVTNSDPDNATSKRAEADSAMQAPPAKRLKSSSGPDDADRSGHSKTRLMQARRERELLRVVTEASGIINVSSKDFYEAHAALVDRMSNAGEATSTRVGSRMDKRTVDATLKDLDARGKIKLITTSVRISTGATRPVRIAYLPEVSETELQTFLSGLSIQQFPPAAPIKTLEEPLVYGGARRQTTRSPSVANALTRDVVLPTSGKDSRASRDPLQDTILNDKNTIAQSHGFIVGRLARARALHLWMTDFLQTCSSSVNVVSVRERVVSFSLFLNDLPISTYCAIVSLQVSSEELDQLLRSREGALTPVGRVSTTIRDTLQIGRWRSRDRLLDTLEVLTRLKVVDPLLPSHSVTPAITVDASVEHPFLFDVAPVESWSPLTAPAYFRLNSSAPLHLWALSEDSPPFWKDVPVFPISECGEYWRQLRIVSQDKDAATQISAMKLGGPLTGTHELARVLRRPSSWSDAYVLSANQEALLKQHMNLASGDTPLQDQDRARLDSLCATIFAPIEVVIRFYENIRNKVLNEKEKMAKKAERKVQEAKVREAQSKSMMAHRAAEAKAQREQDWEDMVANVHPGPLTDSAAARIRRLRTRFLQSPGKNREKWEDEIEQAIQESILAANKILGANKASLVRPTAAPAPLPPVVAAVPEKSVRELIASQGPRLAPRQPVRKSKKGVKDDSAPSEPARRHRFQWNRDYDELARDASAIVRARCRGHHRIDLGALTQAFPAVPKNSVRQRIVHLRDSPGADTYLQRLEDKWYDVWIKHRGTDALPDDDPASPSSFDMIVHLEFLRKHVDKNALRVGFVELSQDANFALPHNTSQLTSLWVIQEKPVAAPPFDFVWSGSAEEGREKQLAMHALTTGLRELPSVAEYDSDNLYVADAAMKMVLSTPAELYDIQAATALLQCVGEDSVKAATKTMLERGILSKIVRDPSKSRPGRTFKISDSNQNAIGGSVPQDVFHDAFALEDVLGQDEDEDAWREWSLLSSDGDMAALLDLVSSNKIEFKVDTSNPQTRRPTFDWNSKKADDDDIETGIMVRITEQVEETTAAAAVVDAAKTQSDAAVPHMQDADPEIPIDPALTEGLLTSGQSHDTQHGKSWDGSTAFCRQGTPGLVDCQACVQAAKSNLLRTVTDKEAEEANRVLDELQIAAAEGLEKRHVMELVREGSSSPALAAITRITNGETPLAYWTGYSSVVLVAAEHIRPWAVCVSQEGDRKAMMQPRRWLDVAGQKIGEVWEAALRAVIGVVLFRPGITQAEIRWRLRSVYDRQEVTDVLRYLMEHGYIERRVDANVGQGVEVGLLDNEEEEHVFWFIGGEKHWYDM